jgi:hypothetical protein
VIADIPAHEGHDDVPMSMEDLRAAADPSPGHWIASRLGGRFGAVSRIVPRGFDAYVRVLHPVDRAPLTEPTTWTGMCLRTGRTPHALMQWEAITTPAPTSPAGVGAPVPRVGRRDEVAVAQGTLEPTSLAALLDVLAPFTADQDCHHALWDGWGWLTRGSALWTFVRVGPGPRPPAPAPAAPPAVLEQALAAPRLSLPGREYLLLTGPLRAALRTGHQVTDDWFDPQSPSLLWPQDRTWCLASEIDLDSTLIGGPVELVEAVLAAPTLEAWRVQEDDDLSSRGDRLNT